MTTIRWDNPFMFCYNIYLTKPVLTLLKKKHNMATQLHKKTHQPCRHLASSVCKPSLILTVKGDNFKMNELFITPRQSLVCPTLTPPTLTLSRDEHCDVPSIVTQLPWPGIGHHGHLMSSLKTTH